MRGFCPGFAFEVVPFASPGDRDRATDLRDTPPDFFTRDLDEALRAGDIDLAIHSAKDVPPELPEDLDWVWLPWGEDPRDAWVLPPGRTRADLPDAPKIGISSDRRAAYAARCFPAARLLPIRGNIEERLDQLDRGDYDAVIMAAAALLRLDRADRIDDWIDPADLPVPEGQGRLCLTFRADDAAARRLRGLFVKAVTFVGAGAGTADWCTVAGREALRACEVCLHDALLDSDLLRNVTPPARCIGVGKRAGAHTVPQDRTTRLIADEARKGRRVVRLKGGDPGIFGRLAEEVDLLEKLELPFRVIPGISSLTTATTGTGMLLTRRGVSRGFCVMSAREQKGAIAEVTGAARAKLPCVFFMGTSVVETLATQLLGDGMPGDTPAAMVINAGADDERIVQATLATLADQVGAAPVCGSDVPTPRHADTATAPPGLVIVGEIARHTFRPDLGALRGVRVLLTCGEVLMPRAVRTVRDLGGRPVVCPMVRVVPEPGIEPVLARMDTYDWVVLTSPSAVRMLFALLHKGRYDLRQLPRMAVSGPAAAAELSSHGFHADLCPDTDFGGKGLLLAVSQGRMPGSRILRLKSDAAGEGLAAALRETGAMVDDVMLYRNEPVAHDRIPEFDAACFASSSAVSRFADLCAVECWRDKPVVAIGPPTAAALASLGRSDALVPERATVEDALQTLAGWCVIHTGETA
jgi:uroporphyrinogen III methyltransferase/synthase